MAKKKERAVYLDEMTPKFLVSYPSVFEAHIDKTYDPEGKNPKFKLTCVWKNDDKDFMKYKKKVMNAAAKLAMSYFGYDSVKEMDDDDVRWNPFLEASKKNLDKWGETFEDASFIRVAGKKKPQIVNRSKVRIIDNDDPEDGGFYAGCMARLACTGLYAYDVSGNQGIGISLANLQKTDEGEPLGGSPSADSQFDSLEDETVEEDDDDLFG